MVGRGRFGLLVAALLVAGLVAGAGYVVAIRPLAIGGSWAVVGMQLDADDFDGRPGYVIEFAPDLAGIRFALMLRNDGPLPMTVRLAAPDAQSAGDLDQIVGLRIVRFGEAEGSLSEEATAAADAVEIPAFGQRWVVFGGRSATCDVARTWNAEAMQSRQAVRLEAALLGVEREVSLVLPFVQQWGPPPEGVCT